MLFTQTHTISGQGLTPIQTCVSTLAVRHLVRKHDAIKQLNDLRAPMSEVLGTLAEKLALLQRYEARYGPLPDEPVNSQNLPKQLPPAGPAPDETSTT
jgi:adenylate cyclase